VRRQRCSWNGIGADHEQAVATAASAASRFLRQEIGHHDEAIAQEAAQWMHGEARNIAEHTRIQEASFLQ
jgi:hypothetical protein